MQSDLAQNHWMFNTELRNIRCTSPLHISAQELYIQILHRCFYSAIPQTMRPTQYSREITNNNASCSPQLKIHKDSHVVKKPCTSSSSSSGSSSLVKSQQRAPVIIYTHSPKIIHTHPRDFMALVQKLTGRSHSDEHSNKPPQSKLELADKEDENKRVGNDCNETSSVVTDENNCSSSSIGDNQVTSCFMTAPIMEPSLNPYLTNSPMFSPNSAEILCSSKPCLNFTESLLLSHSMSNTVPSLPALELEGMNEFYEY